MGQGVHVNQLRRDLLQVFVHVLAVGEHHRVRFVAVDELELPDPPLFGQVPDQVAQDLDRERVEFRVIEIPVAFAQVLNPAEGIVFHLAVAAVQRRIQRNIGGHHTPVALAVHLVQHLRETVEGRIVDLHAPLAVIGDPDIVADLPQRRVPEIIGAVLFHIAQHLFKQRPVTRVPESRLFGKTGQIRQQPGGTPGAEAENRNFRQRDIVDAHLHFQRLYAEHGLHFDAAAVKAGLRAGGHPDRQPDRLRAARLQHRRIIIREHIGESCGGRTQQRAFRIAVKADGVLRGVDFLYEIRGQFRQFRRRIGFMRQRIEFEPDRPPVIQRTDHELPRLIFVAAGVQPDSVHRLAVGKEPVAEDIVQRSGPPYQRQPDFRGAIAPE